MHVNLKLADLTAHVHMFKTKSAFL